MKFKLATAAAAVLMSATASQAADLAKKAPVAVDYVKVCDAYGAGFFYIPGTETCLKIGGYIRAEAFAGSSDFNGSLYNGANNNEYTTRSRFYLTADARSQTEFGLLRSYGAMIFQKISDTDPGNVTGGTGNWFEVDRAFIQWGGLTAGFTASNWDIFMGMTAARYFGQDSEIDTGRNLLAYTFGLGNGLSATLSLEDSSKAGRFTGNYNSTYTSNYGGNELPDLVANLRLAQAWGSAQVMAAAHYINGSDYVTGTTNANGDDKWGWAVGAGAIINLPMLGAGDQFGIQATYADGAIRYVWNNSVNAVVGGTSTSLVGDFYGSAVDGIIDTSTAWGVSAGFRHVFSPYFRADVDFSYADIDNAYAGVSDFNSKYASLNLTWAPGGNVAGTPALAVIGIVEYRAVDFDDHTLTAASASDLDGLVFGLRMQRNF
jgi:hypothetical protein